MRQQCSRFIRHGYDIVHFVLSVVGCVSAGRDTLVLVALNKGAEAHVIDLSLFGGQPDNSQMRAYRTSANEDLASALSSIKVTGTTLTLTLPAQSITTLVIPLRSDRKGRASSKETSNTTP